MDQAYVLEMKHIEKVFPGVRALSDGSLRIKKGEIHGLVGENGAGKSTLMKILLGDYTADNGEIVYKNENVRFVSPKKAQDAGISMIPQEVSMINTMDLAENVWIGRERQFSKTLFVNAKKRYAETRRIFADMGLDMDPHTLAGELSAARRQLLALAKAISHRSDIIIMDEPTSSLSENEVEMLFGIMNRLREQGVSIVFISHKLDEIYTICQRITVLRDGNFIGEYAVNEISQEELIAKIAGREIQNLYPVRAHHAYGPVALQVKHLSQSGVFSDISFQVHEGEILGFYGLVGAGRSEILRAIFGADNYDSGEVLVYGQPLKRASPKESIRAKIAFVTENRLETGIIAGQSVTENISLANLPGISNRLRFVNSREEKKEVVETITNLRIKVANPAQVMSSLSGGNQQKAIIGKWLLTKPKIFILDEPTRGIDVGSKSEIHQLVSNLAASGIAVIIISSELPEVEGMADRIITIKDGRIVGEFVKGEVDSETIIRHAFGLEENYESN